MLRLIIGIIMVLHGLVHFLYFGHSLRFFELQPGLAWPEGSWALSKILGHEATRLIAGISCLAATLGFVVGGTAILAGQSWWRSVIVGSAIFSSVIFILFWDRGIEKLDAKGGIAVLINLVILAALLIWHWPDFEF